MAAKKKPKKAAKAARAKKAPARKSRKAAKTRKARKTKAPAKKAVKAAARKTAAKKVRKAPAKRKPIVGEGDYAASERFRKDETGFVKKNRAKIAGLGQAAEKALEGPEGDALREAEATAAARSRDIF
jgi:hypothetical protein